MGIGDFLDEYSFKARLQPVLLALLPAVFATWAWLRPLYDGLSAFFSILVASGVFVILAQLSRRLGLKVQTKLVNKWGGMPSTLFLRHNNSEIDGYTKQRYHQSLQRLVPGNWTAPTPEEERTNPADADSRYAAAASWLRSNTYDKDRFHLLFKENVSYGFRRNLLGLKPVGIVFALVSGAFCAWECFQAISGGSANSLSYMQWASLGTSVVFLVFWLSVVNREFVREAADRYAFQLLNIIDQL